MYKKMLTDAKAKGLTTELMMWESIDAVEEILSEIKEKNPVKYWSFMREMHGKLYKGHYDEEFAKYDMRNVVYIARNGDKTNTPYWTVEQVEEATKAFNFPAETTKWDKYVALNVFRSDTMKSLPDDMAIKTAVEFFFDDLDFKKENTTKIWDYMRCKREK